MMRGLGVIADVTAAIIARELPLHLAIEWTPEVLEHAWNKTSGFEMNDLLWELRIPDAQFIKLAIEASTLAVEFLPAHQREQARAGVELTRRVWYAAMRERDVSRGMQLVADEFQAAFRLLDPDSAEAYLWNALRETVAVVREPDKHRAGADANYAVYCTLVGIRGLGLDPAFQEAAAPLVTAIRALGPPSLEQILAATVLGQRGI